MPLCMADTLPYRISVKMKERIIRQGGLKIIRETAMGIQERYEIDIEAMGMDKNRIHVLCGAHPNIAPRRTVQVFVSITAREIFTRKPSVKNSL